MCKMQSINKGRKKWVLGVIIFLTHMIQTVSAATFDQSPSAAKLFQLLSF